MDVKLLQNAELVGAIPDVQEDPSKPGRIEGVVHRHPAGLLAESFRKLRTAVLGKMERRGYKTLLIASGRPHAGMSSVAHNLACSLAYHGRRVLLIDANLRRPTQHKLTDVAQSPGLVDVLQNKVAADEAIVTLDAPPMSILPAGDIA